MSEQINPEDVIFVGQGRSVLNWYRCAVPAAELGCDWVGVVGEPPDLQMATGGMATVPDLSRYKVVILQYGKGARWNREVRRLRALGVTVLYEIDDDLWGAGAQEDHEAREQFTPEKVDEYVKVMEVCDGMIVSTTELQDVYGAYANSNVWVCRNGLDLRRYDVTLPERPTVNIGWAGSIGHRAAVSAWLPAVERVMDENDHACFVSIGQDFAEPLRERFGSRVIAVPFTTVENFPAALCNVDIGLAPAGDSDFYLGKSDLRFLEYSAVGVPGIYAPSVYGRTLAQGRTWSGGSSIGMEARDADEAYDRLSTLVGLPTVARRMGEKARQYVREHRSVAQTCTDWVRAIEESTG